MKTLIKNAYIIKNDVLTPQNIGIEGGIISFVGDIPKGFTAKTVIDAKNCIAMPGLVNAHTHSAAALLRNLADDIPFTDWLFNYVIPFENKLTEDDIYWGVNLAAAEMIRSGTTAFADMYIHMDSIAEAVSKSGMRANLSYGPITSSARSEGHTINEKRCADYIKRWDNFDSGRIKS